MKREEFLMKLRYVFLLNTVVALIFAAGLLLAPKTILDIFHLSVGTGVSARATLNFVAQLLGASLVLPGLLTAFAGGMADAGARRSVVVSLFVFEVAGLAVSLLAMLSKVMSAAGWSIVGLFLIFALGYAYFLFMKPSEI
jgi:hypothetical protein